MTVCGPPDSTQDSGLHAVRVFGRFGLLAPDSRLQLFTGNMNFESALFEKGYVRTGVTACVQRDARLL